MTGKPGSLPAARQTHAGAARGTRGHGTRYLFMRAHVVRQSSIIDRIVYDEEEAVLSVTFRGTGRYLYFDVPRELYDAFRAAPSAGGFFNERIKGHFRCARDPARRRFGPNA